MTSEHIFWLVLAKVTAIFFIYFRHKKKDIRWNIYNLVLKENSSGSVWKAQ